MKCFIPVFILLFIINFQYVSAQQDSTVKLRYKKSYWVDIGQGWGGKGSAFNIGISYEIKSRRFISLRYANVITNNRCTDYFLFIPVQSNPLGNDGHSYELSYGTLKKGKAGVINFSAGISFVQIQTGKGSGPTTGFPIIIAGSTCPSDYTLKEKNTIGLTMRGQFIPCVRWGGVGISPYLNINPRYTFASLTFQLALGRLKPKTQIVEKS
jgi:hypothetical protein